MQRDTFIFQISDFNSFFKLPHNVPLTDAVAAVELSFFNFLKNENRKIKSQTIEN
jgi:hypothetical protein